MDLYHGSDKATKTPVLIVAKGETPILVIDWELAADIASAYYSVIEEVYALHYEAILSGRVN